MMDQTLRVLIVDDESLARQRLRQLLEDIAGQVPNQVLGEAADGLDALQQLTNLDADGVDVVLVDIRMPRMDGIELVRQLADMNPAPAIIFVTAYDQYAVQAFDLAAVDYLLKPVRRERLATALRKVPGSKPVAETLRQVTESLAPGGRQFLRSSERGRVLLVPIAEVLYFKADQKYVLARTAEREFLLEQSLAQLESEYGERLLRIRRNCLVMRSAIAGFEKVAESTGSDLEAPGEASSDSPHWGLIIQGVPERLPVSRRLWPPIKKMLESVAV